MRKMMVIAVREFQAAVKTKAFIISIVAMPVMMMGSIVIQGMMRDKVDTTDKRFAVLDQSDQLFETIAKSARERNDNEIFDGEGDARRQTKPRFLIERVTVEGADLTEATLTLSDRVLNGDFIGFVAIGPRALDPDAEKDEGRIAYYSNSPTYDDFQQWVADVVNRRIQALRLTAAELDAKIVARAMKHVHVGNLGLVTRDKSGQIIAARETNRVVNILLPAGLMMLMFMVVMVGAPPLMHSVLEEKTQRIAEVLLGSVAPFQLMMGKLLGTVAVSLTVATIYLCGAFYALDKSGYGQFFPANIIWWFVVFQSLAVLMFGSMFIAIGAAVSDNKEAQSMVTPAMIIVIAPMFVWMNVVKEPSSTSSLLFSLFPPATPMLMIMRQAVPPGIPLWQPLLGISLVLLTTILAVFVASRIFRVGILMQGKGANVAEMVRWVFRG